MSQDPTTLGALDKSTLSTALGRCVSDAIALRQAQANPKVFLAEFTDEPSESLVEEFTGLVSQITPHVIAAFRAENMHLGSWGLV
jgi:hypothetical protein